MIAIAQATQLHSLLISTFGGSAGIRDFNALASALSRSFQTFDGQELYPSVLSKAAALIESILINHPFIDGNKRTGYVLMRLFLLQNGVDLYASEQEKYNFVIAIASGQSDFGVILKWLDVHTMG